MPAKWKLTVCLTAFGLIGGVVSAQVTRPALGQRKPILVATITQVDPNEPIEGQPIRVSVTLKNIGLATQPAGVLYVRGDTPSAQAPVPELPTGQSQSRTLVGIAPPAGENAEVNVYFADNPHYLYKPDPPCTVDSCPSRGIVTLLNGPPPMGSKRRVQKASQEFQLSA